MNLIYKISLFLIIFTILVLAGVWLFRKLNGKIKESETGTQLLGYSLLLFLLYAILFSAGVFALVYFYNLLQEPEQAASPLIPQA